MPPAVEVKGGAGSRGNTYEWKLLTNQLAMQGHGAGDIVGVSQRSMNSKEGWKQGFVGKLVPGD